MTRVRWTRSAEHDLQSLLDWVERRRGPDQAARMASSILETIAKAARYPELYAWVGSIHESLAVLPRSVRRVLTPAPRHAIYYRRVLDPDEIQILSIRGGSQLPPLPEDLSIEDRSAE